MRAKSGFFELSSNRRDIWHGGGMAGVGQLRCDWNLALLKARHGLLCCCGSDACMECPTR